MRPTRTVGTLGSVGSVGLLGLLGVKPLAADTAVFCVVLVDLAGHRGGGDCTKPIEIAVGPAQP